MGKPRDKYFHFSIFELIEDIYFFFGLYVKCDTFTQHFY